MEDRSLWTVAAAALSSAAAAKRRAAGGERAAAGSCARGTRRAWRTSARWATGLPPTRRRSRPRWRTSRASNRTAGRCSSCPPAAGSRGPSTSPAATSPSSSTATPSYSPPRILANGLQLIHCLLMVEEETYPVQGTATSSWDLISLMGQRNYRRTGKVLWDKFHKKELDHTRGHLLEIMYSDHVLISNLTFVDSPFWTIHPVYSSNVIISGVTILAPTDSPNTDGIDPDSCSYVRIEDCYIVSGDDCIAVKSGWDEYGIAFNMPSQHIVIKRLTCVSRRARSSL
uniref:Polygalacturonase n=1 Tax=Ananas comosus var. bracteatus TaxID=296719 RepID=A0A6V7QMZ8_ANACO|nr:unnamed protein product [Ananas comosus var. bracteatus]